MTLPIALAALTLAAWVAIAITVIYSHHKIPRLDEVAPSSPDDPPLPRLSIVVTAHNEERSMEPALRSLLALRYPVLLFTDADVVFAPDAAACPLICWLVATTVSRDDSYPWWSAIPFPLAVLVIVYTIWRSMLLTIFRGVVWGGPPVPLSELRAARMNTASGLPRVVSTPYSSSAR